MLMMVKTQERAQRRVLMFEVVNVINASQTYVVMGAVRNVRATNSVSIIITVIEIKSVHAELLGANSTWGSCMQFIVHRPRP